MRAVGVVLLIATFARSLAEAATVSAYVAPPSSAAGAANAARFGSPTSSGRSSSSSSSSSSNASGASPIESSPAYNKRVRMLHSSFNHAGVASESSGLHPHRHPHRPLSWGGRDATNAASGLRQRRSFSLGGRDANAAAAASVASPLYSSFDDGGGASESSGSRPRRFLSWGGKDATAAAASGLRQRRSVSWGGRGTFAAAAAGVARNTPLGRLFGTAAADDKNASLCSASSPPTGTAFAAAACFRGGGHASASSSSSGSDVSDGGGARPAADSSAAVESLRGGEKETKNKRMTIDIVEDTLGIITRALMVLLVPLFHMTRLAFGLSLLFYGMAFRTFAFHVIVFRIAGWKQVKNSIMQLVRNYRQARQSFRQAAEGAGTIGQRVVEGSELKDAREKMIRTKKKLLADGVLSEADTKFFMNRYKTELLEIKEEQERFKSARSSVFALRSAVNPNVVRSSMMSLYSGLVTCFTASTIQMAGQITLGLHIGNLLKTHTLDLFGPILDPIGYRLDLDRYYDKEEIPYMGRANAMDGPQNMALNILCYSAVFIVFKVHPSIALKTSMVFYGSRLVTDYIVIAAEPARKKLGLMKIEHTPWTAVIHTGLALLGFYYHRNALQTSGVPGLQPPAFGPGLVGLVEPCVRFFGAISKGLGHVEFFRCQFVDDPVEIVKKVARGRRIS